MQSLYFEKHGGKKLKKISIIGIMSHVCGLEDNIVKMSVLPKVIYYNAVLIRISANFFVEVDNDSKILVDWQRPRVDKIIWEKNNKIGGLNISQFQN